MSRSQADLPIEGVPHLLGRYRLLQRKLGKGNYATVVAAIHLDLEVHVAIKIIDTSKVRDQYVLRHLAREAALLRRLAHPNIIAAFESLRAGPLYCLVTELANGGELCTHVSGQPDGHLDENTTRRFAGQLLSALSHMHDRGVVHRDLKMKNILLNQDRDGVKIIDFGLSNMWSRENPLRTHCGSPGYAAPEVYVLGKPYGPEVDMWSLGVVLYGMAVGRLPFPTCRDQGISVTERRTHLITQITKGTTQNHVEAMSHFSALFVDLVSRLLTPAPSDRLTVQNAMLHPWFESRLHTPDHIYRLSKCEHDVIVSHLALMLNMSEKAVEAQCRANRLGEIAAAYNIIAHQQRIKSYKAWKSQATPTIQSKLKRISSVEQCELQDQSSLHSSSKHRILCQVDSYLHSERGSNSQENLELRFSQITLKAESTLNVPSKLTTSFSTKNSPKPSVFYAPCSSGSTSTCLSKPVNKRIMSNQPSKECNTIIPLSTESLRGNPEKTTAQNHVKIETRSSFMSEKRTMEKLHRSVQTSLSDLITCHQRTNSLDSEVQLNTNNITENLNIDIKRNKTNTWVELTESEQKGNVEMGRESAPQLTSKRRSFLFSKGKRGVQWRAENEVASTSNEHTFRQKSPSNRSCKAVSSSSAQNRVELFQKLKFVTEKKKPRTLLKSACPSQQTTCSQNMKEVISGSQSSHKNELNNQRQNTPTRKVGPVRRYKMDVALEQSLEKNKYTTLMPWRIWTCATKRSYSAKNRLCSKQKIKSDPKSINEQKKITATVNSGVVSKYEKEGSSK